MREDLASPEVQDQAILELQASQEARTLQAQAAVPSGGIVAIASGGTGASTATTARANLGTAPNTATYIVQTADAELTAEQALSALASGIVTVTTVTGVLASIGFAEGTYTPTLTNVANLDASTAYQCQYLRVGSIVTVSGKVDIDPTLAATSTQLGISLPVASNLGAAEDCAGTAFASGIAGQGAAILGDAANNRAQLQYISGDLTNQPMYFQFLYRII